jgi:hypothetical protein
MNEREKVAELINEYTKQHTNWVLNGGILPQAIQTVTSKIDALYSDREKAMREALEWACERLNVVSAESNIDYCGSTMCDSCPIKQAKEGK